MKCSHLIVARPIKYCKALKRKYQPSRFELEEYCKTKEHRRCPFYLKWLICTNGVKISPRLEHL